MKLVCYVSLKIKIEYLKSFISKMSNHNIDIEASLAFQNDCKPYLEFHCK